jgi:predicted alpha-1,2-mannosidase
MKTPLRDDRSLARVLMVAGLLVLGCPAPGSAESLCDFVDLQMGVQGDSNCVIGPQFPHGSINPSPQTPAGNMGGYRPGKPVRGFGQLHVTGTGWNKYGQVFLSPQIGLRVGEAEHDSAISDEVATPAYYAARLDRYGIRVELTPSHHAAIYRFTFPRSSEAHLLLDVTHNLPMDITPEVGGRFWGGEILLNSRDGTFSGWGEYSGGFGGAGPYKVFFYARTNQRPVAIGTWKDGVINRSANALKGDGRIGGYFQFSTGEGEAILLKIGVSMKSIANARSFAEGEIPDFDFAAVRKSCADQWESVLASLQIEGATKTQRRIFYTCLYQSFLMPRDRTGDNPNWVSAEPYWDDQFAVWDTWRTKFPLMVLLRESMVRDNIAAFVDRLKHNGRLSDAFVAGLDGEKQGGDDLDHIIADAYVKGVRGVNWDAAFAVLKHNAEEQRYPIYLTRGWLPDDTGKEIMTCSNTLECAYNDYSAALVADGLGKKAEAAAWRQRSGGWEHLWDPGVVSDGFSGFIRPRRSDGAWVEYDPKKFYGSWKSYFYEASSWTYSFDVPHNVGRLIDLCGGRERFVQRLDHAFEAGLMELANEPSFLATRSFNYAGRSARSSFWTRKVMRELYSLEKGYPGNDDSGAMGSWYVFSAMGLFPNAGQDVYLLTGPFCRRITMKMETGRVLEIEGVNASEENIYIQEVTLNGKPWRQNWLRHGDIKDGGHLRFVMGPAPSTWDADAPPPPSASTATGDL